MNALLYVLSALLSIAAAMGVIGFLFFAAVLVDRALERTEFRIRFDIPTTDDPKDWTR